jgi:hypothetical protein
MPRLRRRTAAHAQRRAAHIAVFAAALSLTACGPSAPFEVSVRAVAGDVAYGAQSQPTPAATAQGAPGPGGLAPGAPPLLYGAPPPPPTTFAPTTAATPAPACPVMPPDAVPALAADPSATVPPQPATYLWHETGTYSLGGGPALPFPLRLTHQVSNVSAPDATGSYTFDVTTSSGGLTGLQQVTYSYQVVPPAASTTSVQGVSTSQAAGLYLAGMDVKDSALPTPRVARFAPPLLLMQFPGTDLPSWDTAAGDSASRTTIKLHGAVTKHVAVDACGTAVDAWQVEATGTLVGPNQNLTLTLVYDVATQFGGLIVAETSDVSGQELSGGSLQNVISHVTATTSVVPKRRSTP